MRLIGRAISTVCRAKLLVVSTVFEPKMNLPDNLPSSRRLAFDFAADTDFFISLIGSVPNLCSQSPTFSQLNGVNKPKRTRSPLVDSVFHVLDSRA